jgi:hypothetical protein
MAPGHSYAALCFAAGILLLAGWAHLTVDNPRSGKMALKALWLFALPAGVVIALPDALLAFPLSMWVFVAVEEGLKANAARTEKNPYDKFWLVALFGLVELTLAKPLMGLGSDTELSGWGRWDLLGLTAATVIPVLMHTVTAAIYAFYLKGKIWAQLVICWAVHVLFNESVGIFGLSPGLAATHLFLLLVILWLLWPLQEPAEA